MHPDAPTPTGSTEVHQEEAKPSILKIGAGCGLLLILMCLPCFVLFGYEHSRRQWIQQLDRQAQDIGCNVYNGRRDASGYFVISSRNQNVADDCIPDIVRIGNELISGDTDELRIDLSGTGVTDDGIGQFATLSKLDFLSLTDTLVSREGVNQLRLQMPDTVIEDRHNYR